VAVDEDDGVDVEVVLTIVDECMELKGWPCKEDN